MSGNSRTGKKLPDFARYVDGSAEVTVVGLEYRGRDVKWYCRTEQVVMEMRALKRTLWDRMKKRTRHEAVAVTYKAHWESNYGGAWCNVETGDYMINGGLIDAIKGAIRANEIVRLSEGKPAKGGIIV